MAVIIPDDNVNRLLRSLSLSATEIRQLTGWSDAMIEDYLNILENIALLAAAVDQKNNIIKNITVVTAADSPYEIKEKDEDVFYNTNGGDIITNLRPGVKGTNYRLVNVGENSNRVTINPFGAELLFGQNASEYMADQEAFLISFEASEGWN